MRHIKSLFVILVLYSFAQLTNAQVVLAPKYHQFGKVASGKTYHIQAKITNPTNQTISMWNLQADCSCTTAHIAKAVLKPKASTVLTIDYHPPLGENGMKTFEVQFQVYSQDKIHGISRANQKFDFSAELQSPYTFDPPILDAGYVLTGHARQGRGTLRLVAKDYPHWKPAEPTVTPGPFQAAVSALATPGTYDVELTIPESAAPGLYNGAIHIGGQGSKDDAFDYPFKASVGSVWTVLPSLLDLGVLDPNYFKNWKQSTQIRQVYGHPFKVVKIDGLPVWLRYDLEKDSNGNFLIQWQVDSNALRNAKDKGLVGELKIETDSKEEGVISLPLKAVWPGPPTATPTHGIAPTPTITFAPKPQTTPKP